MSERILVRATISMRDFPANTTALVDPNDPFIKLLLEHKKVVLVGENHAAAEEPTAEEAVKPPVPEPEEEPEPEVEITDMPDTAPEPVPDVPSELLEQPATSSPELDEASPEAEAEEASDTSTED